MPLTPQELCLRLVKNCALELSGPLKQSPSEWNRQHPGKERTVPKPPPHRVDLVPFDFCRRDGEDECHRAQV